MGIANLFEIVKIIRKYFIKIFAFCLAVGMLSYIAISAFQTYTCTLNFKYNYEEAKDGIAPNRVDKLDPYELENPTVIQSAIDSSLIGKKISVEDIRNNIKISEIITSQDNEVKESAAVLGEKYEVKPTEYELQYTYKARLGAEFGGKMFDGIIRSYDNYIISKYYNKKNIPDFMNSLDEIETDYLDYANVISTNLEEITLYMEDLAAEYPNFRSKRTGYTFRDIADMYYNLRDIQYAKFYGNVRAGNLSKDKEMVIKNYRAKVNELSNQWSVLNGVAENYKKEITTFYDSYKNSGLYNQADRTQSNVDSSNNRDEEIFRDWEQEPEKIINTYDSIVKNYTEKASDASKTARQIDQYNSIIYSFENDGIVPETKERLLGKNETVLNELKQLSKEYSKIANSSIDEMFHNKVSSDIQYLMSTDISTDKPVGAISLFLMVAIGGLLTLFFVAYEMLKKHSVTDNDGVALLGTDNQNDETCFSEEQTVCYEQYKNNFNEFYIVYQPMIDCTTNEIKHFEAFIRWENGKLGTVSPELIIEYFGELGLLENLNNWIIETVCKEMNWLRCKSVKLPIIHINCLHSEIIDLKLNKIIVNNIRKYRINPQNICIELNGDDIVSCLEDILSLKSMGIKICIDRFENKKQEKEIVEVVEPDFVKMSSEVFNNGIYATKSEDVVLSGAQMLSYFNKVISKCNRKGISVCICGVETKIQDDIVSNLGFSYKQGYYYAKPMKAKEYAENNNVGVRLIEA